MKGFGDKSIEIIRGKICDVYEQKFDIWEAYFSRCIF